MKLMGSKSPKQFAKELVYGSQIKGKDFNQSTIANTNSFNVNSNSTVGKKPSTQTSTNIKQNQKKLQDIVNRLSSPIRSERKFGSDVNSTSRFVQQQQNDVSQPNNATFSQKTENQQQLPQSPSPYTQMSFQIKESFDQSNVVNGSSRFFSPSKKEPLLLQPLNNTTTTLQYQEKNSVLTTAQNQTTSPQHQLETSQRLSMEGQLFIKNRETLVQKYENEILLKECTFKPRTNISLQQSSQAQQYVEKDQQMSQNNQKKGDEVDQQQEVFNRFAQLQQYRQQTFIAKISLKRSEAEEQASRQLQVKPLISPKSRELAEGRIQSQIKQHTVLPSTTANNNNQQCNHSFSVVERLYSNYGNKNNDPASQKNLANNGNRQPNSVEEEEAMVDEHGRRLFSPQISVRAQGIQRTQKIDQLLYQDALRRERNRQQIEELFELQRQQQAQASQSTVYNKIAQSRLTLRAAVTSFAKEFARAVEQIQRENTLRTFRLSYAEMVSVLLHLRFVPPVASVMINGLQQQLVSTQSKKKNQANNLNLSSRDCYQQQQEPQQQQQSYWAQFFFPQQQTTQPPQIAQQIFCMLNGRATRSVLKRNLLVFLLAVMNIHVSSRDQLNAIDQVLQVEQIQSQVSHITPQTLENHYEDNNNNTALIAAALINNNNNINSCQIVPPNNNNQFNINNNEDFSQSSIHSQKPLVAANDEGEAISNYSSGGNNSSSQNACLIMTMSNPQQQQQQQQEQLQQQLQQQLALQSKQQFSKKNQKNSSNNGRVPLLQSLNVEISPIQEQELLLQLSELNVREIGVFDNNQSLSFTEQQVNHIHQQFYNLCLNRLSYEKTLKQHQSKNITSSNKKEDSIANISTSNNNNNCLVDEQFENFRPHLSPASRQLALAHREKIVEKLRNAQPDIVRIDLCSVLTFENQLAQEGKQQMREQLEKEQQKQCPFRPQTIDFVPQQHNNSPQMMLLQSASQQSNNKCSAAKISSNNNNNCKGSGQNQQQQENNNNIYSDHNINGDNINNNNNSLVLQSDSAKKLITTPRPIGTRRNEELYKLARPLNQKRDKNRIDIEYERECDQCTFAPDIADSYITKQNIVQSAASVKAIDKQIVRAKQARINQELVHSIKQTGNTINKKKLQLLQEKVVTHNNTVCSHKHEKRLQPMFNQNQETLNNNNKKDSENFNSVASENQKSSTRSKIDNQLTNNNVQEQNQNIVEEDNNVEKNKNCARSVEDERVPLLFVDVNIEEGKTARIVVYEGEKSDELANRFAQQHNLDFSMKERLKDLLDQQINSLLTKIDEEACSEVSSQKHDEIQI